MRLWHYSDAPLKELYNRNHDDKRGAGFMKTSGLWVSVEGSDDWKSWCEGENFPCGKIATEIWLKEGHGVLIVDSVEKFDEFDLKYKMDMGNELYNKIGFIDWEKVREDYQGVIISPYRYDRRLATGFLWYYGWDCASGVIWDVSKVGIV